MTQQASLCIALAAAETPKRNAESACSSRSNSPNPFYFQFQPLAIPPTSDWAFSFHGAASQDKRQCSIRFSAKSHRAIQRYKLSCLLSVALGEIWPAGGNPSAASVVAHREAEQD